MDAAIELNGGIIAFVIGLGFVCAAIIAALLTFVGQLPELILRRKPAWMWAIIVPVIAFVGPYWVARASIRGFSTGEISLTNSAAGAIITVLWSFFAGVLMAEILFFGGII